MIFIKYRGRCEERRDTLMFLWSLFVTKPPCLAEMILLIVEDVYGFCLEPM